MIGIGLQQAGQNVLVVEFASHQQPEEGRRDVFVNGASGLPTILRPLGGDRPFVLEEPLAREFDFVLLLGPSLANHAWNAALFAPADLLLFALPPAEPPAKAHDILRRHLGAEDAERSATLVIAADEASATTFSLAGAAQ